MNEELKPCPVCGNAVQVGSCDAFVIHPVSSCELSGKTFLRTIWQESALVNALRAQLAEAQAEIKRLTEEPKLCPFCGGKLYTFAEIVELKTEIANLLSEIAGLRAKHNDYEHPQDSIDRGNRIDQLEIDKFNLKTELKRLQTGVQNILDRRDLLDRYEIASMLADIVKVFP